jgi:hypothetical protein
MGTGDLFLNSYFTINYIAMGIAQEMLQAKTDHIICCRLWGQLFG